MKKLTTMLTVIILILLVISQIFLPNYFSSQLEIGLKQQFDSSQHLDAKVKSFPALLMLVGVFEAVELEGKGLVVDGLKVDELEAEFIDVKLEPKSKESSSWKITKGENKRLKLSFNKSDLEQYLAKQLGSIEDLRLALGPKETILAGAFNLFGNQIDLKLSGSFELEKNKRLAFAPKNLMVANLMVPEEVVQRLMQEVNFSLDLTQLPIPLKVEEVKVERDKLIILGGSGD